MLGVGEAALSVADVYASVADVPSAGGIALFSGVVRNEDEGRAEINYRGRRAYQLSVARGGGGLPGAS